MVHVMSSLASGCLHIFEFALSMLSLRGANKFFLLNRNCKIAIRNTVNAGGLRAHSLSIMYLLTQFGG